MQIVQILIKNPFRPQDSPLFQHTAQSHRGTVGRDLHPEGSRPSRRSHVPSQVGAFVVGPS